MNDPRGVAVVMLAVFAFITFAAFPFGIIPALDGLAEWQVRHG